MSSNRGKRRIRSTSRSHPYDMGNINNWYSEQFRVKLAEWNILAPANYTKAELKSLYVANVSNRSDPNQIFQGDSMVSMSTESTSSVSSHRTKSIQPVETPVPDSSSTETNIQIPSNELQSQVSPTGGVATSQNSMVTDVMVNMMSTMTSMMQQVFEKMVGRLNNVEKLWTISQQADKQVMTINAFLLITIIRLAYILNKLNILTLCLNPLKRN